MRLFVAASSPAVRARRRAPARSRVWTRRLAVLAILGGLTAIGLGLVFAGSPDRLAKNTRIAGGDVGGLTPPAARRLLAQRSERLASVPVVFTAGDRQFRITPRQLGVQVDW